MFLTLTVSAAWADTHTIGWGSATGTAGTYTNFTATSGTVTDVVSFSTAKNSASSDPAYNSGDKELRLYFNSTGNGCSITLTPVTGVTITAVKITASSTSYTPTVKYNVNSGNDQTGTWSTSTMTISGISATTSLKIRNANTTNKQLRIKTIQITYTAAASCDKQVTVNKGTPSNGSFSISKTGTYETCDAPLVITLSNITPPAGYQFGAITQTGIGTGVTIDQANKTVTYAKNTSGTSTINVTFEQKQSATITLSEAGVETGITGKYVGDSYTLPIENDFTCGDKTFVGWSTVPIDNSVNKPTTNFYEPGASVTLQAASQTFYAVFAETGGTPTTSWPKTDVSDLKDGDEVVIVMNNSSNYAMTNDRGTGTAPDALLAKIKNDCLEDLPVSETIIWVLGKNSSNLTFYKDNTKKAWLYCTNTNNGVRVGSNANKTFTIDSSTGYLKHTGTSRYVGVYNSSDWRCYTSTSTNIGNQTLAFYKKTTTGGYKNYTTSCVKTYKVTFNANGRGTAPTAQNVEENTKATEPTDPSATGYTFDGWYTDQACSDDKKFVFDTPITEDITLYAKWTAETYTITLNANGGKFVKDGNESETIEIQYVYGTYANYDQAKLISDYLAEEGIKLSREGYQLNEMWQSNGSAWKRVFTAINRTITAQWSKLYIVTLSENGTTKELTPQTATSYTLPTELSAGSCQDDTKEFVGWTTNKELSSETTPTSDFYEKGKTVTLTEDATTFYAVFATVDGGGATDNTNVYTSNVSINAGTAITNTSVVIDQEEYDATKAGTGSAQGSVLVTIPAGTTYLSFYMAGWKGEGDKTITLTGVEAEPSSFKTIADNGVTGNENYELVGNVAQYAYSTTLNNVTQETQITFSNGGADQRFVIWGVNASAGVTYSNYSTKCVPTCKITYNFDGGEGECTTAVVEKGSEYTLCSTVPTKAGHEFLNWKDQNGGVYAVGATITSVTEDLTLTAQWQVNSYEVTWMSLGDEVLVNKADYNTQPTKPATDPTYKCSIGTKEFVGWSTQEIDGAGVPANLYTDEFPVVTEAITYHAVFASLNSIAESTIHTLTPNASWNGYKEGTITDDKEYIWSYNAAGQFTDGVYSLNLRNKDTETSYIGSPLFTASVKSIKATIVNGSLSKTKKVYVCSAPTLEPKNGDLGITEVAGGYSGELSLAFEGTISQFYLQVSDALQFQSIVVEVGTDPYIDYTTSCPILELTEGENTLADGVTADVKVNRSFTTGNLYTISLPFALDAAQVNDIFGIGTKLYQFAQLAKEGEKLVLYFSKPSAIAAATPYLIQPTQDVAAGFTVENATISTTPHNISFSVDATTVTMKPILSATAGEKTNGTTEYWLAEDTWLYNNENTLLSLRALFNISTVSGMPPRCRVALGENVETGIDNLTSGENTTIKLIENGQLIIIRNGEKYNIQGQKL